MGPITREEVTCEVLMSRFQAGDRAALATLVGRHKKPLYNFVLRLVRSPKAAEDLVQDVFVKVVQSAGEFRHESRFSPWAYTLARNLSVDHLRATAHHQHASPEKKTTTGAQPGQRVAGEVEALPEEQREVFLLREIANLPFKDIAVVTGVPESTVKSRMRHALERLQESLTDHEGVGRALR